MDYKIVYLEDQDAKSVISDLENHGLDVTHCKPSIFKETIVHIDSKTPDLILMDFRLQSDGGDVNAPAFSQYYRSIAIDDPKKNIPIVLLSNDDKIHDFYKDFTSQDLFDFSINKTKFEECLEKYASLMKELITSYKKISSHQSQNTPLVNLLCIPEELNDQIDPRIKRTLTEGKFITNIYMTSAFILNNIVKPIGVLVGEDVLAARIGISKSSPDWDSLCEEIEKYKYKGTYHETYKRWWAEGIEIWWNANIENKVPLRRVSSTKKQELLKTKLSQLKLNKVDGDKRSKTEKFWTICHKSSIPVDPSEAFEAKSELSAIPWIEHKYYSYESVRDNNLVEYLTDADKSRYKLLAKGSC